VHEVNQFTGESYPLGMHRHNWPAAFATSALARILIEEKFGDSPMPKKQLSCFDPRKFGKLAFQ
jgi:hypothetical protein